MSEQIQNRSNKQISIIIVTKNDYENLLTTYDSFQFSDQIKNEIQLILINGGSDDETQSFIKSHSSDFSKIISEPDLGIYDAINKGIKYANGGWAIFMNAGDTFAYDKVLENIQGSIDREADILYGDCILKYPGFNLLKKACEIENLWKGMITTHQSFIIKTELLKKNPFDLVYKLGADFDQVLKLYKQKKQFKYIPITIAAIDTSGVSNRKITRTRCEHHKSLRKNEQLGFSMHFYYVLNFVYLVAINITRLLLPKKIYYSIIKAINKKRISS
ncbi:MAG: glycosyltransferase [Bacteroidales bacterium]|nr:glycosyltransferase [Bacteroidales bacterium]